MKRFLVIVAVVLSSVLVASGQECTAPDICGVWLGQEKTSKIAIYRKGNLWEGKAVWYSEYGDIGDQNIIVLRDLNYDAKENEWTGKIYDPFHDKTFNVTVSLQRNGKLKVVGRAGIISKTMLWTRTDLQG